MKKLLLVVAIVGIFIFSQLALSFAQSDTASRVEGSIEQLEGQDFFVFNVYVDSSNSYPTCYLYVDYDDTGHVDRMTSLMPTTSIRFTDLYGIYIHGSADVHSADSARLQLVCGNRTASLYTNGNTLPYQGVVNKIVELPAPTNTATTTSAPLPTYTASPQPTATLAPSSTAVPTLVPTLVPTNTEVATQQPTATPCMRGNSGKRCRNK